MVRAWKLYNLTFWTSWILIVALPQITRLAQYKLASNESSLFWKHLLTFDHPYTYLFLILVLTVSSIKKWRDEDLTGKYKLCKFLEFLHIKHFPYCSGGKDPDCRITVFVPGWKIPIIYERHLKFYARSGSPPNSKAKWSITKSVFARTQAEYDGVVGYAWARETFIDIDDLPDYDNGTEEEKEKYLNGTYITKGKINSLSWKARSFRCLVIRNEIGQKVGALMMESKKPDGSKHIKSHSLQETARILQCFFP